MQWTLLLYLVLLAPYSRGYRWLSAPFRVALRRSVQASSTCGYPASRFCLPSDTRKSMEKGACRPLLLCAARVPGLDHTPEKVVDGLGFSWWQSEVGVDKVFLVIDLQQAIQVARIRVAFKVPSGGHWIIQRSRDGGRSFMPWHYFVESDSDCHSLYGLPVDQIVDADDASCSVSRSSAGFQITVDLLKGRPGAKFLLSQAVQDFITADAVRLDLLQFGRPWHEDSLSKQGYYAIWEIGILGRCWCCAPRLTDSLEPCQCCNYDITQSTNPATSPPVNPTGKHPPKGVICSQSGAVQAGGKSAQSHRSSRRRNESIPCVCKMNVAGPLCTGCKPGYYQLEKANPLGCRECNCDPLGSLSSKCNSSTGQCYCRGGYTGRTCNKCKNERESFPSCHGHGNCSAFLMKSLRSFERTTARQVKAMEGCPPPILPINYHNTALELSSKQRHLESQLDEMALNVTSNEQEICLIRGQASQLGEHVSDMEALIDGSYGKSRNLIPLVRESFGKAKLLLSKTKHSATRVTHVIKRGRKLLNNLETASVQNLGVLGDGRDLLNEISLVDFAELKRRLLDSLESANQTALISRIACIESERLYEAAKRAQFTIATLEEVGVRVYTMEKTWDEVREKNRITDNINSNAEKIFPWHKKVMTQMKHRLMKVEMETNSAHRIYSGIRDQIQAEGDGLMRSLRHDLKELAQSRNRSIELILLVLEADGYALSLTKDVEEMKGYYEDLIEEGHPVAIFLHYLPLIIHEIDTAQSHAKSVHIIAREVLKRSKWVKNKAAAAKRNSVMYLKRGKVLKKNLGELHWEISELSSQSSSLRKSFESHCEKHDNVSRAVADLSKNAVLPINGLVKQSRVSKKKSKKSSQQIKAIAQQVNKELVKLDELVETIGLAKDLFGAAVKKVESTKDTLKTAKDAVSRITNTQQDMDSRLTSFEKEIAIMEAQIEQALSDSKRLKNQVMKKKQVSKKKKNKQKKNKQKKNEQQAITKKKK